MPDPITPTPDDLARDLHDDLLRLLRWQKRPSIWHDDIVIVRWPDGWAAALRRAVAAEEALARLERKVAHGCTDANCKECDR